MSPSPTSLSCVPSLGIRSSETPVCFVTDTKVSCRTNLRNLTGLLQLLLAMSRISHYNHKLRLSCKMTRAHFGVLTNESVYRMLNSPATRTLLRTLHAYRKYVLACLACCGVVLIQNTVFEPVFIVVAPSTHDIVGTYTYGTLPVTPVGELYYVIGAGSLTLRDDGLVECTDHEVKLQFGISTAYAGEAVTVIPAGAFDGRWCWERNCEPLLLRIDYNLADGGRKDVHYLVARTISGMAIYPCMPDPECLIGVAGMRRR